MTLLPSNDRAEYLSSLVRFALLARPSHTGGHKMGMSFETLGMKLALVLLAGVTATIPVSAEDGAPENHDEPTTSEARVRTAGEEKRPNLKFMGARSLEGASGTYIEECLDKIRKAANLDYPEAAKNRLYGSALMSIEVLPTGEIRNPQIHRSTGHPILDEALVRWTNAATPCAPFPPELAAHTDILVITRTYTFAKANTIAVTVVPTSTSNAADATKRDWIRMLVMQIRSRLIPPSGIPRNAKAVFRVSQRPDGTIEKIALISSSGFPSLDTAIERAIVGASPLPTPVYAADFEPELELIFRPMCDEAVAAKNRSDCPPDDWQTSPTGTASMQNGPNNPTSAWRDAVRQQVRANFLITPRTPAPIKAVFSVVQRPDGTVEKVAVKSSSGFQPFDRAAEEAILASSPFPAVRRDLFKPDLELTFACDASGPGTPEPRGNCSSRNLDVR